MRSEMFLVVVVLGCGPEKDTTSNATEGKTSDSTAFTGGDAASAGPTGGAACAPPAEMRELTDSCCCFSTDAVNDTDVAYDKVRDNCGAGALCPVLTIQCRRDDPDCAVWDGLSGLPQPISVNDENALHCVLDALGKGGPGLVSWTVDWGLPTADRYYIQEDRTVLTYRADSDEGGLLYLFSAVTRQVLKPPGVFELCAADPDLRARVRCLQAVTTGELVETCEID